MAGEKVPLFPLASGIEYAFSAIRTVLSSIQLLPTPLDFSSIFKSIMDTKSMIRTIIRCLIAGQSKVVIITEGHCNPVVNFYRSLVDNAIQNSPKTAASENTKRLVAGTMALLELSKTAVAEANEDLLRVLSIFTADVLAQYREELLRMDSAEISLFGQANVGMVVSISNSLEACLRVAVSPAAAVGELNRQVEAQARLEGDEDGDEDEYEDDE